MGEIKRETSIKVTNLSWLSIWRKLVPSAFLLAVVLLLWYHQYPLSPEAVSLLLWLSRLDPLMLLAEWRATGSLPVWFWLPLGVVILTLLFGRVFCGWICPVGGVLARIPIGRNRLKIEPYLYKSRYIWLVFVLILLLFSNWPLFLTPFHLLTEEFTRLWQGNMPWLLTTMLLAGILFFPRFWCVYICPTGLLLAGLSCWRYSRFAIGDACIDCGSCGTACQTQAMNAKERRVAEDCMLCGRCWQKCPSNAVKWHKSSAYIPQENGASLVSLSRRQFVQGGLAVVVGGFSGQLLQPTDTEPIIRPPGALTEVEFLARCSRCGRCIKVCPAACLFPMPLQTGLVAFLTPRVLPRQAKCELCLSCQEVCPTGAIDHVPLSLVKMGIAELDRRKCLVWVEHKLCLLCREQCPVHAIEVDEENRPYVNSDLCVGCGACENGCPLREAAIIVRSKKTIIRR